MTEYERTLNSLKEQRAMLDLAIKTMEYVEAQGRYIERLKRKYEDCRSVLCSICPKSNCDGCQFKPLDDEDIKEAVQRLADKWNRRFDND